MFLSYFRHFLKVKKITTGMSSLAGAGSLAGEKIPGAVPKEDGSKTLLPPSWGPILFNIRIIVDQLP